MPKNPKARPQVDAPPRPCVPQGVDLGGASTHFIKTFKNAFLSINLD